MNLSRLVALPAANSGLRWEKSIVRWVWSGRSWGHLVCNGNRLPLLPFFSLWTFLSCVTVQSESVSVEVASMYHVRLEKLKCLLSFGMKVEVETPVFLEGTSHFI